MSIPPLPQTQALSSATFRVPILDGSVTLPEIFDWHAKNSPNHPVFVYSRADGTERTIFWPEAVRAVHRGARFVRKLTGGTSGEVVAILAASDTISAFTMTMSVMRADTVLFSISPRNSPAAVAHLISTVKVSHILVGREQALEDLVNAALRILAKSAGEEEQRTPKLVPIPVFEDLFVDKEVEDEELIPYSRKPSDLAWYLHSSGSTAFPKPIPWTHKRLIELAIVPWFGERDLTGQIMSVAVVPMFHAMGVIQPCFTAACGLILSTFEPASPAQKPTADALFTSAKETESDLIYCVPAFVEAWANKPDYIRWLATRAGVIYAGGPLNKEIGDYLVSQGVSIFNLYGSTEAGFMNPVIPKEADPDWDYFKFSGLVTAEMVPQGDGTFEFVMVENPYGRPSVINTTVNGKDAYASSDLLIPHPTREEYWRIWGRTDDQIMHSTGEKTNPGPLENIMNRHPKIQACVMFGRGRFQAGILIEPKPEFRFDPTDTEKAAGFRNEIWETVEKVNEYAPQHSRIFKEMIIFSEPSKPFTYTAKGTARRQPILNAYEKEINQLYDDVEASTQSSLPAPTTWHREETLEFVRKVVLQALGRKEDGSIRDDDDLFEHGCDSLQATWIRNSLLRALRDSAEIDTRTRTDNFVYQYPTISRLAEYVFGIATGNDKEDNEKDKEQAQIEEMEAMVKKYTTNLPERVSSSAGPAHVDGEVVVLVGSTGALGSQMLFAFIRNTKIKHVYALNRRNTKVSLLERQRNALREHGLPVEVLDSEKVSLLEVDFSADLLGLERGIHEKIQQTVSRIIHNAWRVDFNVALSSFESNIKFLRRVLDLGFGAPNLKRLVFVSSIGVVQGAIDTTPPVEEKEAPPAFAIANGYSQSKWVAEEVLEEARKRTGLPTLVVRLGQISGSADGAWNVKEWFPSLVQASAAIGSLPIFDDEKVITWLPAQKVAECVTDLIFSPDDLGFAHLVHSRPVSWSSLAKILSQELNLELVPYNAWVHKLEEWNNKEQLNATLLLPFYRAAMEGQSRHQEGFGLPDLDITSTVKYCETLATLQPLGEADVKSWLGYWRRVKLI